MKKWTLFLSLYFCLCLLTSCASSGGSMAPVPGSTASTSHTDTSAPESPQPAMVTETFRIITAEEPGTPPLLLAKMDGTVGDVYRLSSGKDIPVTLEWATEDEMEAIDWSYQAGTLVEITHDGILLETYPLQFSNVTAIHVLESGFNDRCDLYLQALEDLWGVDPALNENITYVGMDLSETSLPPAERSAVAWAFANRHHAELIEGTLEGLMEQGYITGEPLGTEDAPADAKFWHWEDGCFFSITEQPMEGVYSLTPVTFDAHKWRSSLGAYWFCDCTALQSALGDWSDYQIGTEMIS